jgi:phosphodiesterase/alkaline phosphatase D-like protein
LLLIILLLGLGGLAYFGINQFGWGDTLKDMLGSFTGGGSAGAALEISDVQVVNIGVASAEIMWETNNPASTQVEYWVTSTDVMHTEETDVPGSGSIGVISHKVKLTGLEPGTKYYYRVKSGDTDGQVATEEGDFTTQQMPAE